MRLKDLEIITKKKDFSYSKRFGLAYFSRSVVLQTSGENLGINRVGFIVSRKVGIAVIRNLVKRRLRSIVQESVVKHGENKNYIFIARKNSAHVSYTELNRDVLNCLKKSHG